jgi:hypothetical protein
MSDSDFEVLMETFEEFLVDEGGLPAEEAATTVTVPAPKIIGHFQGQDCFYSKLGFRLDMPKVHASLRDWFTCAEIKMGAGELSIQFGVLKEFFLTVFESGSLGFRHAGGSSSAMTAYHLVYFLLQDCKNDK